ncbi:MAG: alpha-L-rhamnosidase N-terminal domain-containing protein, partial [Prolixibacteraceae bacterium]
MKKVLFLFFGIHFFVFLAFAQVSVSGLLTENRILPEGIDQSQPQFSWQLNSDERNVLQTAYEIRVSNNLKSLKSGHNLFWTSGKISSDQSVHVSYSGPVLKSATKYFWQVRVWDNRNHESKWSEPVFWSAGLLTPENWKAHWIQAGFEDTELRPSPMFRKEFQAQKTIKSAMAFVSARGLYEAEINGKKVGDAYFTPGWTAYDKRIQYQTFDVTSLLQEGNNAIGVTLGNGWYRGYLGIRGQRDFYGSE